MDTFSGYGFDFHFIVLRKFRVDLNHVELGIIRASEIVVKARKVKGSVLAHLSILAARNSIKKVNEGLRMGFPLLL